MNLGVYAKYDDEWKLVLLMNVDECPTYGELKTNLTKMFPLVNSFKLRDVDIDRDVWFLDYI